MSKSPKPLDSRSKGGAGGALGMSGVLEKVAHPRDTSILITPGLLGRGVRTELLGWDLTSKPFLVFQADGNIILEEINRTEHVSSKSR